MIYYKFINIKRQRIAAVNKVRVASRKQMKAVTTAARGYKKEISKLKSFAEAKKLKKPTELKKVLGKNLADLIILSFYYGDKRSRKPKKSEKQNLITYQQFLDKPFIYFNALPDPDELWKIDWNMPQEEALAAFRAEAFKVAGVLTDELHAMIKLEAEKAFSEGISFGEWKKQIKLQGFEADNPFHLRTNFNTAINNSYLAANWIDAEDTKDLFPYLRYVGIMDDRIRDEHAALHGTIAKLDDSFWNINYPPNGWNCRCDVEQLTNAEAEADPKFGKKPPKVKIDENFAKNSGKDKTIWGDWLKDKT